MIYTIAEVMKMLIKLQGIKKAFGEKKIFNHLNLEIKRGEIFALIGPNGVGKTTLMRMILNWDRDFEGEYLKEEGIKIGYSPETPVFPEILSGRQVLEYYMEERGFDKSFYRKESVRLMEKVGLSLKDTRVKNYSKGMKQRLAVAQALIGDPDLLLLDEPSAGQDFLGQQQMQDLIAELKKDKKGILLNSHLLYDVEKVADRGIIIMNEKICREFTRDDFKKISLADMFLELAKEVRYEGSY